MISTFLPQTLALDCDSLDDLLLMGEATSWAAQREEQDHLPGK
jgi:hypothetical protein